MARKTKTYNAIQPKDGTTASRSTVIAVPLRLTRPADERRDFMAAVLGAIRLR